MKRISKAIKILIKNNWIRLNKPRLTIFKKIMIKTRQSLYNLNDIKNK